MPAQGIPALAAKGAGLLCVIIALGCGGSAFDNTLGTELDVKAHQELGGKEVTPKGAWIHSLSATHPIDGKPDKEHSYHYYELNAAFIAMISLGFILAICSVVYTLLLFLGILKNDIKFADMGVTIAAASFVFLAALCAFISAIEVENWCALDKKGKDRYNTLSQEGKEFIDTQIKHCRQGAKDPLSGVYVQGRQNNERWVAAVFAIIAGVVLVVALFIGGKKGQQPGMYPQPGTYPPPQQEAYPQPGQVQEQQPEQYPPTQ